MSLQTIERERAPQSAWRAVPVTQTVTGFEGARIVTGMTGGARIAGEVTLSNAAVGLLLGAVYYAGAGDYDPEFVASILHADAVAPEAKFNNVVDMLDWLNRE